MEAKGKLHLKHDTKAVSDKFQRREFVLEIADNPMYPQYVTFQLTQEKCSQLDMIQRGSMLTVEFNLRGRQWTDPKTGEEKYFTTLEAWRIIAGEADAPPADTSGYAGLPQDPDDSLPF